MAVDKVEELTQLKRRMSRLQSKIDQAKGALEGDMKRLRDDWGCDDLDAARALLKAMKADLEAKRAAFEKDLVAFKDQWGDKLQDLENELV